ncbi:hypothetical protein K6V92_11225 [Cupriavidus respiraculi]|uniref:hypothetical protein n=1 Tax=Cupriavidus respiraculi TaxID=195930 RepID=UPI001C95DD8A|nr:hypothetical protein [Cupriavidus respiraculi]MBY4947187.1 hypothetical protein [Cupriavidus respiraculi]
MRPVRTAVGRLSMAFLLWPGLSVLAEPQPDGPTPAIAAIAHYTGIPSLTGVAVPASTTPQDEPAPALSAFGKPVDGNRLDDIRGGAEVVVNDMRLSGTVADNYANRIVTGTNAISDGAFSNSAGLPTVIQNSGANVLIQNATILNVQFRP